MRLRWSRVPRWPRLPLWAAAIVGAWGSLVLVAAWIEARTGRVPETCLFHGLTGRPCPTCGSTRAFLALRDGSLREALSLNPLVVVAATAALGLLLIRLLLGWGPRLDLSPRERRLVLGLGGVLVLLNWGWLIWRQR